MKVYTYLLNDSKLMKYLIEKHFTERNLVEYQSYPIYAYTRDKKLAKKFRASRRGETLTEKVLDLNRDDLDKFEYLYYNECMITYSDFVYSEKKRIYMKIPVTYSENWYSAECKRETINSILEDMPKVNIDVFSPKLRDALMDVNYDVEVLGVRTDQDSFSEFGKWLNRNGWKNEFGLFLKLYGDTIDYSGLLGVVKYVEKEKCED